MNKKITIGILGLMVFATIIGIVKADIKVSIEVKDSNGNSIDGQTVPINTIAYVYGHYEDLGGNAQASAIMEVYYDDGSGWKYEATLFSGRVNDGDTVEEPYTLTKLGYYQFRWTCEKEASALKWTIRCTRERAMARATVQVQQFDIPEPGLIELMALLASGLLALKRTRLK